MLLPYMYQQQICSSYVIPMSYAKITQHWEDIANIYARYEVAPSYDVARIAVYRK